MPKLSELIAEGAEIRLSNGKQRTILMKRTKNGWITQKGTTDNKANKGRIGSVILKEEPKRYIRKLYASQYKIVSPSNVQLDW
ncbi:MAG: hypothetical protein FWH44_06305 [Methanomassiliicoccaceae archaeon]|nr:hypothetical protein [Methanomassiliicoccaceae archaeon]